MKMKGYLLSLPLLAAASPAVMAGACDGLPSWSALQSALSAATLAETSGLNKNMWGTVVARDGTVCAVAFTGPNAGAQWPGSRVISAQKANTANAFSLDASSASASGGGALALSTANLYTAVQPGGSLYGLQHSNPVDPAIAYRGNSALFGTAVDPMVGGKVGGVNVFGGGLALYNSSGKLVGGVGVSGDTSCSDHYIAWRTRANLKLDYLATGGVPGPASLFAGDATHPDNIILDITANPYGGTGLSATGFGHAACYNDTPTSALPPVE